MHQCTSHRKSFDYSHLQMQLHHFSSRVIKEFVIWQQLRLKQHSTAVYLFWIFFFSSLFFTSNFVQFFWKLVHANYECEYDTSSNSGRSINFQCTRNRQMSFDWWTYRILCDRFFSFFASSKAMWVPAVRTSCWPNSRHKIKKISEQLLCRVRSTLYATRGPWQWNIRCFFSSGRVERITRSWCRVATHKSKRKTKTKTFNEREFDAGYQTCAHTKLNTKNRQK